MTNDSLNDWPDNLVAERHEVSGNWVIWYLNDDQAAKCHAALSQQPASALVEALEKLYISKGSPDDGDSAVVHNVAIDSAIALVRQHTREPDVGCPISEDILEAVINEHDMNVPDELLASPGGFGAHRGAMRKALEKIIPLLKGEGK